MRKVWVGVVLVVVLSLAAIANETLDVYFINVGHGDAILVKYGTDEWLIDTGFKNAWPNSSICSELLGVEIDLPVEHFILSHADLDHYSALDLLLCSCGIEQLYSSDEAGAVELLEEEIRQLSGCDCLGEEGVDVYSLSASTPSVFQGSELDWSVLHPTTDYAVGLAEDNNKSVVLLLTFGSVSFLFSGDIEVEVERVLGRLPKLEGILILKVAHHGSDSSTSLDFLKWAGPELAIVSADPDDLSPIVAVRLASQRIPYLSTADVGTIHIRTDGNTWWIEADLALGLVQSGENDCLASDGG